MCEHARRNEKEYFISITSRFISACKEVFRGYFIDYATATNDADSQLGRLHDESTRSTLALFRDAEELAHVNANDFIVDSFFVDN